jgi:TPR repeat protein
VKKKAIAILSLSCIGVIASLAIILRSNGDAAQGEVKENVTPPVTAQPESTTTSLTTSESTASESAQLEEGIKEFNSGSTSKAYYILMPLALKGHAPAQSIVGQIFMYGFNVVEKDLERGRTWLLRAAAHNDADAMYHLGRLYENCRLKESCSEEISLDWYTKSAKLGYLQSQLLLGYYYYNKGFLPNAEAECLHWFKLASSRSYKAKIAIGKAYLGDGAVTQDYKKAYQILSELVANEANKPLDTDLSEAKYLLGLMYARGLGIPKDDLKAYELFKASIDEDKEANLSGSDPYGGPSSAGEAGIEMQKLGL